MFIQRLLLSRLRLFTTPLDHIHWIANSLAPALENIPPSTSISVAVQLYITSNTTTTTTDQGLDKSSKESCSEVMITPDSQLYSTILQSPFVQVFYKGRPNLKQLISNEIDDATGRVSINGLCLLIVSLTVESKNKDIIILYSLRDPFTGQ